ncbi:MAG: patatin-like phospholipase family protein, partial [Pseudomonadales bacterium]
QDVLPRVISGSSAGAMMAATVGTHTDTELKKFFDPQNIVVDAGVKKRFLDWFLLGREGRLDIGYIEAMQAHFVRDLTFQEAFELTGHAINISISPAEANQKSRLLNAITSPNVYIRSAVKASCAVPGAMAPVMLEAKSTRGERVAYLPSRRWVDGSVSGDMPAKRLARLYGVNHFIASQTNPLVLWAMSDPKLDNGIKAKIKRMPVRMVKDLIELNYFASKPLLRGSPSLNIVMGQLHSMVTQSYTGDINIIPRYRLFDPRKLARRWSEKEMQFLLREGEMATWPKIEMIRSCMKIGRKLDSILADFAED